MSRNPPVVPRHPTVRFEPGLVTVPEASGKRPDILNGFACDTCNVNVAFSVTDISAGELPEGDVLTLHDFFVTHWGHKVRPTHFDNRWSEPVSASGRLRTAQTYDRGYAAGVRDGAARWVVAFICGFVAGGATGLVWIGWLR